MIICVKTWRRDAVLHHGILYRVANGAPLFLSRIIHLIRRRQLAQGIVARAAKINEQQKPQTPLNRKT